MSDFSTVTLSSDMTSIPSGINVALDCAYQCKDLPDDGELSCCVDGMIEADGRFVRTDDRGRFWVPNFTWWVRLTPQFGGRDLYVEFRSGRAVKFQWSGKEYETQRPDDVPNVWIPVEQP